LLGQRQLPQPGYRPRNHDRTVPVKDGRNKIMTNKVFITGVAGFLGSHLADAFLKLGWEVGGIDSLTGGHLENIPEGVVFRKAECNNRHEYIDMLENVSLVYHCAA